MNYYKIPSMSEFHFGNMTNNGPIQIGNGNTQNNSGTFSYSFNQLTKEVSEGFNKLVSEVKHSGKVDNGEIEMLSKKKDEIVELVKSVGENPNNCSILVKKTGEFVEVFNKTVKNIENGTEIGNRLYTLIGKMLPVLVPVIGNAFGII